MKNWNIKCDFDGTVSLKDTTDFVLENLAHASWEEVEQQWKNGEIDSAECMGRQAALINATPEEIAALLDKVEVDAHFADFVKFCDHWNIPVSILSDGYDFNINTILRKNGLGHLPVVANKLKYKGGRKFGFETVHHNPDCRSHAGTCKCGKLEKTSRNILIGDGRSDFCAAETADIVLAKDSLLDYCKRKGIPHIAFNNFADVKHILARVFMMEKGSTHHAPPVDTAIASNI